MKLDTMEFNVMQSDVCTLKEKSIECKEFH